MEIKFWKDPKTRTINTDLFDGVAEQSAQEVSRAGGRNRNKPTQLRKFYDEVLRLESLMKDKPEEFEKNLPYLKMLNAKVAYAKARDLVTEEFRQMIKQGISQVDNPDSLKLFARFFEAFMGYYKFHFEREAQSGARR